MKKKIFVVLFVVLVILAGGYLRYKTYILSKYKMPLSNESYSRFLDALEERTFRRVNSIGRQDGVDYVTVQRMSLKNDYEDFTLVVDDAAEFDITKYVLYSPGGTFTASISFGRDIVDKVGMIKSQDENGKKAWRSEYLDKLNIKTDMDLINYVVSIKDKEYTIFTSINEIRGDYEIHRMLSNYALGNEVVLFNGDIEGYMTKVNDRTKEAFIFKDGVGYFVTFLGLDYFNIERIQNVLENLVIE